MPFATLTLVSKFYDCLDMACIAVWHWHDVLPTGVCYNLIDHWFLQHICFQGQYIMLSPNPVALQSIKSIPSTLACL